MRVIKLTEAVEKILPKISDLLAKTDAAKAKAEAITELKTSLVDWLKTGALVLTVVSAVLGALVGVFGILFKTFKAGIF